MPDLTPASCVRLAAYDASPPEEQRARYVQLLAEQQTMYGPWSHTAWSMFSALLAALLTSWTLP